MKFTIEHQPMPDPNGVVSESKQITFNLSDVDQLYEGRGNCCRCGCGGNYYNLQKNKQKIINCLTRMERGNYHVESIDDYIFEITLEDYYNQWGEWTRNKVQTIYLNK